MGLWGAKDKKKEDLQKSIRLYFCEICGALVNVKETKQTQFCQICMDIRMFSTSVEIQKYKGGTGL